MSIDPFWKFWAYFHLLTIVLTNYRFIPFIPGLLRRPSTHSYSLNSTNIILHKGRQQPVPSLRSFTDCCHIRESSQEGLCASGARSNASTVSCSRSRSGRRKAKKQSICHTFRFVHLPVSAGGPIVAVSTPFVKAAKCRFALNMHR